ncbi:MAG: queuosine precursor transporter [Bacteroidales bacterium]|nr:queuosine precursor transporter [Candidatus Cryptobacteroides equifaecalis]
MKTKFSATFLWLAATFCVCLIVSNIFVPRTWQLGSLPFQLSGAIVLFPISYIINDLLTEVYGYRKARFVIWMGFILSAFIALMSQLVTMLPDPMTPENKQISDNFNSLFRMVPRSTLASLLAFIVGSSVNAWIMSAMKVATKGKGFGWRAIISTLGGEAVDSLIFFPLALSGILPARVMLNLVITQVVAKTFYEILVLPFTTVIVKKVKQIEGEDTYDEQISYNPFKLKDM